MTRHQKKLIRIAYPYLLLVAQETGGNASHAHADEIHNNNTTNTTNTTMRLTVTCIKHLPQLNSGYQLQTRVVK